MALLAGNGRAVPSDGDQQSNDGTTTAEPGAPIWRVFSIENLVGWIRPAAFLRPLLPPGGSNGVSKMPSLFPTVGEIARRLNEPIHRVSYIIRSRGITPGGWAGNSRVFAEADIQRIAAELAKRGKPCRQ